MPSLSKIWNETDSLGKAQIVGSAALSLKSVIVDTGCGILAGAAVDHFIKDKPLSKFERFAIDAAAGAAGSYIGHHLTKYDQDDMNSTFKAIRYFTDKEDG